MTKKLIIFIMLIVVAGCVNTDTQKELIAKNVKLTEDLRVSQEMLTILSCESDFRHNVKPGDNGKSHGIAQFKVSTFNYLKGLMGRDDLKISSKQDQLVLLEWSIRNGYEKNWSCATVNKGRII